MQTRPPVVRPNGLIDARRCKLRLADTWVVRILRPYIVSGTACMVTIVKAILYEKRGQCLILEFRGDYIRPNYGRCTLGEISSALEESWGRHLPSTAVVRGAYSASYNEPAEVSSL